MYITVYSQLENFDFFPEKCCHDNRGNKASQSRTNSNNLVVLQCLVVRFAPKKNFHCQFNNMYKYLLMICMQAKYKLVFVDAFVAQWRSQSAQKFMQPNLDWILGKLCFWRESVYSCENNQYFCGEFTGRKSWVKFCSWRKILGMKGSNTDKC